MSNTIGDILFCFKIFLAQANACAFQKFSTSWRSRKCLPDCLLVYQMIACWFSDNDNWILGGKKELYHQMNEGMADNVCRHCRLLSVAFWVKEDASLSLSLAHCPYCLPSCICTCIMHTHHLIYSITYYSTLSTFIVFIPLACRGWVRESVIGSWEGRMWKNDRGHVTEKWLQMGKQKLVKFFELDNVMVQVSYLLIA
jgi:hypothetical protein